MTDNRARDHIAALARDMRAARLDYYAEHLEWVLSSFLQPRHADNLDIVNSTSPDLAEGRPGVHNR